MAGLTAAFLLEQQNIPYQLFEPQSHWGGKLQTKYVDGFALDYGFQVIQSAYPALDVFKSKGLLDDALAFGSGAWVITNRGKTLLADPLREFPRGLAALGHPAIHLSDVFRVVKLRQQLLNQSPEAFFQLPNPSTTLQYLRDFGFSDAFIEVFFRPFFTGIFLEEALDSPCSMFQFVFWALSKGKALLMPEGIQTLPIRIVGLLDPNRVHLNHPPKHIQPIQPIHTDENKTHFSTRVHYFSVDTDLGLGKFIALNATQAGNINLLAIPTAVQKGYAPQGKHLLCVSEKPGNVGHENPSQQALLSETESLLQQKITAQWLDSINVPKALPSNTPYVYGSEVLQTAFDKDLSNVNLYATGEIGNPSLNAAILRGVHLASVANSV